MMRNGSQTNAEPWPVAKPKDCAIAFGIPVSLEEFLRREEEGFAAQFHGRRERIAEFVRDYALTSARMTEGGASLITDVSLANFGELFASGKYGVVVLFSHVEDGKVEFRDGLAEISQVIAQVPPDFAGIVDITTCGSRDLFRALKRDRPSCFPFYSTEQTIDARAWLIFYRALFEYLGTRQLTYQTAFVNLVKKLIPDVAKKMAKMTKLQDVLQLYLERIGRHGAHLGSERPVTDEDNLYLRELLAARVEKTDYLIILALIILCVSYVLAVLVVIYVRHDSLALKGTLPALLVFTLWVVRTLRRFWIDKTLMRTLIVTLHELPPAEAANFADVLYWRIVKGHTRRW
jgi:hypothetical protein